MCLMGMKILWNMFQHVCVCACFLSLFGFTFCGALQSFGHAQSQLSTDRQNMRKDELGQCVNSEVRWGLCVRHLFRAAGPIWNVLKQSLNVCQKQLCGMQEQCERFLAGIKTPGCVIGVIHSHTLSKINLWPERHCLQG